MAVGPGCACGRRIGTQNANNRSVRLGSGSKRRALASVCAIEWGERPEVSGNRVRQSAAPALCHQPEPDDGNVTDRKSRASVDSAITGGPVEVRKSRGQALPTKIGRVNTRAYAPDERENPHLVMYFPPPISQLLSGLKSSVPSSPEGPQKFAIVLSDHDSATCRPGPVRTPCAIAAQVCNPSFRYGTKGSRQRGRVSGGAPCRQQSHGCRAHFDGVGRPMQSGRSIARSYCYN
jgi:hypothetical protein